eukprot:COSAG05_NODE_668_length_8004_cov_3.894371_5_plen_192_part_00
MHSASLPLVLVAGQGTDAVCCAHAIAVPPSLPMSARYSGQFEIGADIEVHGLQGAPQHNGKRGKIVGFIVAKVRSTAVAPSTSLACPPFPSATMRWHRSWGFSLSVSVAPRVCCVSAHSMVLLEPYLPLPLLVVVLLLLMLVVVVGGSGTIRGRAGQREWRRRRESPLPQANEPLHHHRQRHRCWCWYHSI